MQRVIRRCVAAFAAITVLVGAGAAAAAEPYPSRPVKVVVPYAAGQGTDVLARYLSDQLTRSLGQTFVVENKPGAGGNIGSAFAAKQPNDGYTVLMGTNGTHAAAPFLYADLGFDPDADFEPVALVVISSLVIVTRADNPVDSIPKLIEKARAQPGKINVAYTTTSSRAVLELFKQEANAPLYGVPYKGSSQAIGDLLGGQVEFMADTIASLAAQVNGGKLKALGVSSKASSDVLPGVKSIAEQGVKGYELTGWNAFYVPKGTPSEIVKSLGATIVKIVSQPESKAKLTALGMEPRPLTGPELNEFLRAERAKWGGVIKSAGIKAD